jgi:hypothetical protein
MNTTNDTGDETMELRSIKYHSQYDDSNRGAVL